MTDKAFKPSERLLLFLADHIGPQMVRLLGGTWRITYVPPDAQERVRRRRTRGIFAFWHCHLLSLLVAGRDLSFAVPVSEHRDGEYVARIMARMGFRPVRGSATRGGVKALLGMIRASAEGYNPAITPDGPKGPRHAVLPGIVYLAQATRLPIIPMGIAARSKWVLPSWDRFEIPKPFADVHIIVGEAIPVPPDFDRARVPELCERVRSVMERMTAEADRMVRGRSGQVSGF